MEYAKAHEVKPSPIMKNPKSLANEDVHDVSDTKFDDAEGIMAMDWNDVHVSDESYYKPSEDEGPS